jgi:hypothetical protein
MWGVAFTACAVFFVQEFTFTMKLIYVAVLVMSKDGATCSCKRKKNNRWVAQGSVSMLKNVQQTKCSNVHLSHYSKK